MISLNIFMFGGRGQNFILKKDKVALNVDRTTIIIPKGTRFTNIIVIAGDGKRRKIDEINNLTNRYSGKPKNWSKRVATAKINGTRAEVHYYQNKKDNIGRVKYKIKRWKE